MNPRAPGIVVLRTNPRRQYWCSGSCSVVELGVSEGVLVVLRVDGNRAFDVVALVDLLPRMVVIQGSVSSVEVLGESTENGSCSFLVA